MTKHQHQYELVERRPVGSNGIQRIDRCTAEGCHHWVASIETEPPERSPSAGWEETYDAMEVQRP